MERPIFMALASYLGLLPLVIVWIAGLALSLARWQRHPKVSLLTLIATGGFLITSFVSTYLNIRLPLMMQERGLSTSQMGSVFSIKGIANSLVSAALWVLLLLAIFGGNGKRENRQLERGSEAASSTSQEKTRVSTGLLVAGWIFTILGGAIGIAIASSIAFGKRYDDQSRAKGKAMFITAIVLLAIYIALRVVIET